MSKELKKPSAIRMSALPEDIRGSIETLGVMDENKSSKSAFGNEELINVVKDLTHSKEKNRKQTIIIVVLFVLLIVCVFVASIVGAKLAKDTTVDPVNGIMYATTGGVSDKSDGQVLKTEDAIFYGDNFDFVGMPNNELSALKEIYLKDGDMKFLVRGYGRIDDGTKVMMIVEGGSITWDADGSIFDATGMADVILSANFETYGHNSTDASGRRYLMAGCEGGSTGSGSHHEQDTTGRSF